MSNSVPDSVLQLAHDARQMRLAAQRLEKMARQLALLCIAPEGNTLMRIRREAGSIAFHLERVHERHGKADR